MISNCGFRASDGIPALVGLGTEPDRLAERFVAWFEKLFFQPTQASAWLPERLEYQFAVSTPERQGEKVFVAEEYFQGHLDWYNFDIDQSRSVLGESARNPEAPDGDTHDAANTGDIQWHAEHTLVGVRRQPHKLR